MPPAPLASATVLLRYAAKGSVAMRGPSSRQAYVFSDSAATPVLKQDANALLRSGLLERIENAADASPVAPAFADTSPAGPFPPV